MYLKYSNWKRLHESDQSVETRVTLSYSDRYFSNLENMEMSQYLLKKAISEFYDASISDFKYYRGMVNANLHFETSEEILRIIGLKTDYVLRYQQILPRQSEVFTFIKNAAMGFPNVIRVVDESSSRETRYTIFIDGDQSNIDELLDHIFSKETITTNYPSLKKDTLLSSEFVARLIDNEESEKELNTRVKNSVQVAAIQQIREGLDVAAKKLTKEDHLAEIEKKLAAFEKRASIELDLIQKEELFANVEDLQKAAISKFKQGQLEKRDASAILKRIYRLLDSIEF